MMQTSKNIHPIPIVIPERSSIVDGGITSLCMQHHIMFNRACDYTIKYTKMMIINTPVFMWLPCANSKYPHEQNGNNNFQGPDSM